MSDKYLMLRRLHGRLNDWIVSQKKRHLIKRAYYQSKTSYFHSSEEEENYPVDFVVTWVDGNDTEWQSERNRYSLNTTENEDNSKARFREWGTFKYWFRAVEKNAPWVRNVFLVTYGHLPDWLNIESPKLKVINHKDFIPKEYLPTFSSHTIEWNLWRIPGLSEHFVYFNDDMYIINPVSKSDFFKNGYPCYSAIAQPMITYTKMAAHRHARLNSLGIINSYFDVRNCIEDNAHKWFNFQYGKMIKYNQLAYEDGYISGMYFSHLGTPFRKSATKDFCCHFQERVHETCMNKFRTSDDIMHQAIQMWEIFNGSFEPIGPNHYGKFISPTLDNLNNVISEINGAAKMLCINDHNQIDDEIFEKIRTTIIKALDDKYKDKSCFEL